jgi:hypothetical protein
LAKKRVQWVNEAFPFWWDKSFFVSRSMMAGSLLLPCLTAGREIRHCAKRQTVIGYLSQLPISKQWLKSFIN